MASGAAGHEAAADQPVHESGVVVGESDAADLFDQLVEILPAEQSLFGIIIHVLGSTRMARQKPPTSWP